MQRYITIISNLKLSILGYLWQEETHVSLWNDTRLASFDGGCQNKGSIKRKNKSKPRCDCLFERTLRNLIIFIKENRDKVILVDFERTVVIF